MTADQLKLWRSQQGWTQKQAASHFGVSLGSIRKWESGEINVPTPIARLILSATEIKLPLETITAINEAAAQYGVTFDQMLSRSIRVGIDKLNTEPS